MQPSVNNIVEICVPLIIILLGTAYPIILNNISNIGEKYHSKYIIALFKQERFLIKILFNGYYTFLYFFYSFLYLNLNRYLIGIVGLLIIQQIYWFFLQLCYC